MNPYLYTMYLLKENYGFQKDQDLQLRPQAHIKRHVYLAL